MASQLFEIVKELVLSLLANESKGKTAANINIPIDGPAEDKKPEEKPAPQVGSFYYTNAEIDWTKVTCQITAHVSVGEAITLHAWNRLANADDGLTDQIKANIVKTCQMMEEIRNIVGCPINIHCMFRSEQYNKEVVKAIPNDVHAQGEAADWDALPTLTIEQAKEKIRPHLEKLNIRLEGGTPTWLHNDWHAVGPSGREFKA